MKHIHLVTPYQSAAMRRMYEPLKNELAKLYEVTASAEVDETADLNYHIPWHTLAGFEKMGISKHAIAYTHCNVGGEVALMDACERADLITCMTFTGRKELVDMGVDPAKLWVIYSAADQFIFRKRLIGIVGYPQPNGRKREGLLLDLAWNYDMTPFQFIFLGGGWEDTVNKLQSLGVSASSYDAQSDEELRPFYHIDLFLVTGYREGGPLPLLEAMASGADVLSPRFGYASDLLEDAQIYDSLDDLADKLEAYAAPYVNRHKLARAWRWQDYCLEHALLFGRMLGESVDLYPEFGASRYAQLLDEIDGLQPREIVEIGTWSGSRAIQMIQQVAKYVPINEIYYQGFDLFESQTGEQYRRELSKQGWDVEIVEKRIRATGANVKLVEGETRKTLRMNNNSQADLFFIDGGHSEATIEHDGSVLWIGKECSVFVFDDYYHAGKPAGMGCNRFIDTLNKSQFEITHLPVRTKTDDGREIGMVKVQRKNADLSIQRRETLTESFTRYVGKPRNIVSEMQLTDA